MYRALYHLGRCLDVDHGHLPGRGSDEKLVTFWVSHGAYCLVGNAWVLYGWTGLRLVLFYPGLVRKPGGSWQIWCPPFFSQGKEIFQKLLLA